MLLYRRRIDHVYDRRTARRRDVRLARTRVSLFRTYAAADLKNNYAKYASYTIKAYLDEKGYSQEFQRKNILARVNAMYFCFDTGPETTPFVSVMSYYTLQEAFGTPFGAERLYFVQGAQFWLRALAKNCGATVYSGTGELSVTPTSNGAVQVSPATGPGGGVYDACVCACHADDALRTGKAVLTAAQSSLLGKFTYTLSTGVAHADVRLLPPNRNAWRTYNVRIRDTGEAQSQYAMTYVENRHQNDSVAIYDHYDLPEFYVSLNPYRAPDPKLVLADIDGTPVQSTFYHNLVDQAALAAQHELWAVQGNNNLCFAGGYTHGAGLHIECWLQAADLVGSMLAKANEVPSARAAERTRAVISRRYDAALLRARDCRSRARGSAAPSIPGARGRGALVGL